MKLPQSYYIGAFTVSIIFALGLGYLVGQDITQREMLQSVDKAFEKGIEWGKDSKYCPEPALTIEERQKIKVYAYQYGQFMVEFKAANFEVMKMEGTLEHDAVQLKGGLPLKINEESKIDVSSPDGYTIFINEENNQSEAQK